MGSRWGNLTCVSTTALDRWTALVFTTLGAMRLVYKLAAGLCVVAWIFYFCFYFSCVCACCCPMEDPVNRQCCQENERYVERMKAGAAEVGKEVQCITQHPNFEAVCLNRDVLRVAYFTMRQHKEADHHHTEHEIPRPRSVIQVSRWLKKTVHVINFENTDNAVNSVPSQGSRDSPTPRTPVLAKPLTPQDMAQFLRLHNDGGHSSSGQGPAQRTPDLAKPLTPQSMAQFLRLHNDGQGGQGPTQAAQRPRGQVASGRHTTPNPYQTLLEKANGYFLKNGGDGASVSPQFQADLVKDIPQLTDVQAGALKAFLDYAQQNAVYNPDGQVHNNGLGPGPAMFANLLQNPHSVPATPGPLSSGNSPTSHIDNMVNKLVGNDGQTLQRMLETQNLLANNAVGAENNAVASSWGGLLGQMFPAKSIPGDSTAGNQGGSLPSLGGNIPSLGGNIPSPGGSIPSLGGNLLFPDGNIPSPGGSIPSLGVNIPSLGGNIPSPDGNIPSPGGSIPSLAGNIPSLAGNIPSLAGNILSPDGNVLSPSPSSGLPSTDRNLPYLSGSIAFPVRKLLSPGANITSPGGRFSSLGSMEYGPEHLQTQENQNLTNIYSVFHDQFLPLYFRSKGMLAIEGLGKRTLLTMTEVEKRYLATPALTDISYIPDVLKSKVTLVTQRDSYRVGDGITIRVDLRDKRGRIRNSGGDEVRIWLKSPDQNHSEAAEVTDLGNGSYSGATTLKWAGPTQVHVSLTYSREFLRLVVELRHGVLATRWIVAKFRNARQNVFEITPCLPSAPIPGYASSCDLSELNGGMPWFCGQPTVAGLTCGHWALTGNLPFLWPLPISGPALQLETLMNNSSRDTRLIPNDILISTLPGRPPPSLPPCWSRSPRESWGPLARRGWLNNGEEWIPDGCALPQYSMEGIGNCMRNTTLLLLGDSNMRMMFSELKIDLNVTKQTGDWHAPIFVEIPRLNSSMMFAPHARPFNSGGSFGVKTLSVARALKRLPPHRNYVIVLHYWLHFGFYPVVVFRDRVRQAKAAIKEFLVTRPTAKVFLRGPHVVYTGQGKHAQFGDKFGPWFIDILKQEFEDMYDRVWLLDFWPMTIASENFPLHPPPFTTIQMLRVLFGYACRQF